MAIAGIVLAGGQSSRMGTSKAALEWHGSTLLRRVTGLVARAVRGPVLVVRAPAQALPALAPSVEVLDDAQEGLGPLQGLAVGLAAASSDRASVAFVCSTDMPFLHPLVVRRVLRGLTGNVDVAMPVAHGHPQPLAAAYRTALAPRIARWIGEGKRRMTVVAARSTARVLDAADLLADDAVASADPHLESLINLNTPDDYRAALAQPVPLVTVRGWGGSAGDGPYRVRAASLGQAADAVDLSGDGPLRALLDGVTVTDRATPLVPGDEVTFIPDGR
jgi:molybdopterin-guanine dinucleotide biosynthesis protein A